MFYYKIFFATSLRSAYFGSRLGGFIALIQAYPGYRDRITTS
jgi:hypothetical protein